MALFLTDYKLYLEMLPGKSFPKKFPLGLGWTSIFSTTSNLNFILTGFCQVCCACMVVLVYTTQNITNINIDKMHIQLTVVIILQIP